ncbi:hypothetical protein AHAS_Ahas03G0239200 [Arachis hypogaea]
MDPRPITWCRREARIKVYIDDTRGRWYVEQFCDDHNHTMLDARFMGLMRSHRSVKEGNLHQINSMRKASLRMPTIFRTFVNQSGGFKTVEFEIKDIYNAIEKQRRAGTTNADASVFEDVLRFDATYSQNKYKCPLVIFSSVDHHMRTVVFGCTILSNESEESYLWLLRLFLEAMKEKQPKSVMRDGDLAMKSAVSIVFRCAHHRLCSWHLLRNATAKVGRPGFL